MGSRIKFADQQPKSSQEYNRKKKFLLNKGSAQHAHTAQPAKFCQTLYNSSSEQSLFFKRQNFFYQPQSTTHKQSQSQQKKLLPNIHKEDKPRSRKLQTEKESRAKNHSRADILSPSLTQSKIMLTQHNPYSLLSGNKMLQQNFRVNVEKQTRTPQGSKQWVIRKVKPALNQVSMHKKPIFEDDDKTS